jgi:hypothetical protein
MGAMKDHSMDLESMKMLMVMNDISNARDEYREEMFRLRDLNDAMLAVLGKWSHDGALQTLEDRERFRTAARAIITKAEGHQS